MREAGCPRHGHSMAMQVAGPLKQMGEVMELFEGRLARYKHPKDVHFLERLPRTALGKVRKEDVRAVLQANAGEGR